MDFIAFLAASVLGLFVFLHTANPLMAVLVWVGTSLLLDSTRARRQADGAWGWDSGDASDCGGGDGGD